eukprot:7149697-Heterocapsa_arctica.AAC.1
MAFEAGVIDETQFPAHDDIVKQAQGHDTLQPEIGVAAAAKGPWMLDSGASDYLVGGANLSKKDKAACTTGGPSMLLATANGN